MAGLRRGASPGAILDLIRTREAKTRAELMDITGLSRSTLGERLDALFDAGLIQESGGAPRGRGRPSRELAIGSDSKVALAADIGEDHLRLVMTDLSGQRIAEQTFAVSVAEGPEPAVAAITRGTETLLADSGRSLSDVLGLAMAVPAPVDFLHGRVGTPSVMTGWDGVDIEALVRRSLDIPVLIENDVNA